MMQTGFSRVREVVAAWQQVRALLRSGDHGNLVPVVIPRDRRGYGPFFWLLLALYWFVTATRALQGPLLWLAPVALLAGVFFAALFVLLVARSTIVEIEEGTVGVLSSWGAIVGVLEPGRRYIWQPWQKVEAVVDTSTEIPYTAPVLSSPTKENVPLKSIEFFLKFRITDPVRFIRQIGASNFDIVLSSAVQDAIRQRSRAVETARAYSLRGADVSDMQESLNRVMARYGVVISGATIPHVELADQYREALATRETVAKAQAAYEKEWSLKRQQQKDALLLKIEDAKKVREAKRIGVNEARNHARQAVANALQAKQAEAEKIRLDIEAAGKARLKSAENEALALERLGEAYQDNRALLHYDLETERLRVSSQLIQHAPRPVLVRTNDSGEGNSLLSTLLLSQLLPQALGPAKDRRLGEVGEPDSRKGSP